MTTFYNLIILRFGEPKLVKEKCYVAKYVKTFNVKNGDRDKNNELVPFPVHDENILQKI